MSSRGPQGRDLSEWNGNEVWRAAALVLDLIAMSIRYSEENGMLASLHLHVLYDNSKHSTLGNPVLGSMHSFTIKA